MSDKTKHTPGPWVVRTIDQSLATVETQDGRYIIGNAGQLRADDWKTGHIERRANARLIAAAPELLEALQEMVAGDAEAIEEAQALGVPFPEEMLATFKKARAAIARATGETP